MIAIQQLIDTTNLSKDLAETATVLRINEVALTLPDIELLTEIEKALNTANLGKLIITDEFNQSFSCIEVTQADLSLKYNIKIEKSSVYFISKQGFGTFLKSEFETHQFDTIGLLYISAPVKLAYTTLIPLDQLPLATIKRQEIETPCKQRITKAHDLESQALLPVNIKKWIVPFETENIHYPDEWKIIAARKTLASISSEISYNHEANTYALEFKGPRKATIIFSLTDTEIFNQCFMVLNDIANWIFNSTHADIEIKHILLNNEISRIFDNTTSASDIALVKNNLTDAFESSQLAFKYHLSNISKDLQKSLAELNKTLFDYISKIRQNTSDITNSLWRDFTTVFGFLILSFALKKNDTAVEYFNLFCYIMIGYISISYFINASSGFWFYYGLKNSLTQWRSKLYSYMSSDEYNISALTPIKNAFRKFRFAFIMILFCYLFIILLLLYLTKDIGNLILLIDHNTVFKILLCRMFCI